MSPDRGDHSPTADQEEEYAPVASDDGDETLRPNSAAKMLADRANEPQNFTFRGVVVGLLIGVVICFSNMYFGLQTGWVSSMAMPSALLGFAYFKAVSGTLSYPFSPVENVLVQSVAGSVGTMPLGCGFVGVVPALNFLLKPEENGPLQTGLWKLIVWAVGIAFFGVVFAVPLRKQFIIREKLKFPSGTATALMIGVLHGDKGDAKLVQQDTSKVQDEEVDNHFETEQNARSAAQTAEEEEENEAKKQAEFRDWKAKIRLLFISFGLSAFYVCISTSIVDRFANFKKTLVSYFIPQLRDIPVFGTSLATNWLWTLNPSPAYIGQGIIMGPATTMHMLLGAIVGWGILSPLAKSHGWAPGPVSDWTTGSKGWIVWISLAIMLADSLVSLGWLVLRPIINHGPAFTRHCKRVYRSGDWKAFTDFRPMSRAGYAAVSGSEGAESPSLTKDQQVADDHDREADAPPSRRIGTRTTLIGLVLSLGLCIGAVHYAFADLIPLRLTILALVLALLLSVMGVRALGETDLNPVSGISKLTQLLFAFVVPKGNKNAIIINLVAGALSESGALQAGDLLQDLKAGHLVGAAPSAQFYGQIIGSAVGAVLSAAVYKLYTHVYTIPGGLFEIPTGFVWIFTARLVTGQGLPPKVPAWALGSGLLFAVATAARTWSRTQTGWQRKLTAFIPGGIAVAVGMYNTPSFTLARAIGGLLQLYWTKFMKRNDTPLIVLASGLILGEGLFSIVNLLLASMHVPHL